MADEKGYIMGYDSDTGETYIQLEEFPYFAFLRNGNLKGLSPHNQTYGAHVAIFVLPVYSGE